MNLDDRIIIKTVSQDYMCLDWTMSNLEISRMQNEVADLRDKCNKYT